MSLMNVSCGRVGIFDGGLCSSEVVVVVGGLFVFGSLVVGGLVVFCSLAVGWLVVLGCVVVVGLIVLDFAVVGR